MYIRVYRFAYRMYIYRCIGVWYALYIMHVSGGVRHYIRVYVHVYTRGCACIYACIGVCMHVYACLQNKTERPFKTFAGVLS